MFVHRAVGCPRPQPGELGDVPRGELSEAVGTEQLHRADDLFGEDLDGAVHTGPAAGHQPVEVGTADQGELGAERDAGGDVGAVHDARVDADLDVAADLTDHRRQ